MSSVSSESMLYLHLKMHSVGAIEALKKITPVPNLTTAYSKQASYDSLAQNI